MILRYLFGLTGTAITNSAIGSGATRSSPSAIQGYLDQIKLNLDVDGNGQSDAPTDGLMVLRYLFGLRGDALITGAIGNNAARKTAQPIETYIGTLR